MSRNGSGTMSIPNSFTPSTTISSSAVNANFSDIANEITNSVAADGQTTMTGVLKAANGADTAPSVTFGSDLDTGLYRKAANSLGFATAGSERAYIDASGKLFALGAADIAGALNLQAALTGVATTLVAAGSVLTVRGSADDTSFDILAVLARGAGSGDTVTIEARGDGSDGVDAIGFGIGGTQLFHFDATNFDFDQLTPQVGADGDGDSVIEFYDDTNDAYRSLFWDDSESEWRVEDDGGTNRTVIHSGNLALVPGAVLAIIEDQKSQGTNGQSLTAGADRTRELTTLVYNRDTIASLSSNQFTLPAGTWEISWCAPVAAHDAHQSLLYNVTDTTEVKRGTGSNVDDGDVVSYIGLPASTGSAVVTIAGSKAFEIRHRVADTMLGGEAANLGTEIYTRVEVRRA